MEKNTRLSYVWCWHYRSSRTSPQIIQVYTTKSASGVSLLTWILLTLFNMLWTLYGAAHKDKQLFFANALMVLFDLILIIGVLMY